MILVADIGGTNSRVALGDRAGTLHNIRAFKNAEITDLYEPLSATVAAASVTDAVLAVAGPVDGDVVSITNYPWKISRPDLESALGLRRLTVINDFVAAAYAVPAIGESELSYLREGERRRGNVLVCGPGTGFGCAALIDSMQGLVGVASEAGHAILGAANDKEEEIFSRLREDGSPLSIESILSGDGMSRLYGSMHGNSLRSEEIIARAGAGDESASAAITLFLGIFGRVSGDLALIYNATSGVFLAGGVGRALAHHYEASPFLASFCDHPPYSERLSKIPIAVLLLEQPGLLGALQFGLRQT
jgi:glucokinase